MEKENDTCQKLADAFIGYLARNKTVLMFSSAPVRNDSKISLCLYPSFTDDFKLFSILYSWCALSQMVSSSTSSPLFIDMSFKMGQAVARNDMSSSCESRTPNFRIKKRNLIMPNRHSICLRVEHITVSKSSGLLSASFLGFAQDLIV